MLADLVCHPADDHTSIGMTAKDYIAELLELDQINNFLDMSGEIDIRMEKMLAIRQSS